MDFREAYKAVHPSVVGLGCLSSQSIDIIGTGFVLHRLNDRAVVMTNEHMISALSALDDDSHTRAVVFRDSMRRDENGDQVAITEFLTHRIVAYGLVPNNEASSVPDIPGLQTTIVKPYASPDIGLVIIECADSPLSAATLDLNARPEEGEPVALLGFPLGVSLSPDTDASSLQSSPILQVGVMSAILPNRRSPHRMFLVHIYSSGGCSGSPLFDSRGTVIGVVCAAREAEAPDVLSSQLLAVPLAEIPADFQNALTSGNIASLYEWISEPR